MPQFFNAAFAMGLGALPLFGLAAQTQAQDDSQSVRIPAERGVSFKARANHAKPTADLPCPTLTPGYTINPREAVNEASIRDWAHNGVVRYQAVLGEILLTGKLATRDPQEASYWLQCAAQAGDADASLNLAMQIYHGDGVAQDFARVLKLAEPSARAGSASAQHLLGNMYSLGQGTTKDVKQAVYWHTKAAQQGNVAVQAALGFRYLTADGVERDLDSAIKWLRLAAKGGHQDSQSNLEIALCMQEKRCDIDGQKLASDLTTQTKRSAAQAMPAQKPIKLAAHWKAGQSMRYVYEKSRQRAGSTALSSSYELQVKVLRATVDSFVLELTLPRLQLPDQLTGNPQAQPMLASAAALGQSLRLQILTDENGSPQTLQNWEQVRDTVLKFVDQVSAMAGASVPDSVRATLKSLYIDEASTRQVVMNDLDFFLRPLGDELVPDQPTDAETELPTALMGNLKGHEKYLLKKDQPKTGQVTETFERTFDDESLTHAIDTFLKRFKAEQAPSREKILNQMKMRDRATYIVDTASGWLVSGEHIREVGVNADAALETLVLRVRRK